MAVFVVRFVCIALIVSNMALSKHIESVKTQYKMNFMLKKQQLDSIKKMMEKEDSMVSLPTGFGKSIIYLLPPLIMDDVSIILFHSF